jgi:drug/metabolite transporter (DMT)-like permease
MTSKTTALLVLAFAILTWGISPVFVRSLALASGPADSIVIRMCSVAIICSPLLAIFGWRIERADIPKLILTGSVGMFGYFLGTIFGFARVSAGIGGIIISTQPMVIALMAAALGTEKLSASVLIGMAISFAGSLFLFSGDAGAAQSTSDLVIGGLMIFACGIAWAIYTIFSRPLVEKYGTLKITAWSLFLCAPPALVFASSTTWSAVANMRPEDWQALFFLSVIATFIALVAWNFASGHLRSTTMGASLYIVPVLAVAAGWLVLGENVTPTTLIAGILILAGVAIAEFGKSFLTRAQKA